MYTLINFINFVINIINSMVKLINLLVDAEKNSQINCEFVKNIGLFHFLKSLCLCIIKSSIYFIDIFAIKGS